MSMFNEVLAQNLEMTTRVEFFNSMIRKKMSFYDQAKIGKLMALATNDVRMMNLTISPGIRLLGEPVIALIGVTILAFLIHPLAGLILVLSLPIFFFSVYLYHSHSKPLSVNQQDQFREMNDFLQERIQGNKVIKGFNSENKESNSYSVKNKTLADTKVRRGFLLGFYYPGLVLTLITGFMFLFGVYLFLQGDLSLAGLITLNSLLLFLRMPILLINNALQMVQLGLSGAESMYNLLYKDVFGEEEKDRGINIDIKGKVEYRNVWFEYINDKPVLKNINFSVNPGETVAILGPTGSGKTSLLKLLTRFYEISKGEIFIDDISIRDLSLENLRSQIGIVEQDIFLFSTSIKDNISYSKDVVPLKRVEEVSKLAKAHQFILDATNGYDTVIGERGLTLSGGQKQRIGLARAFLADPKVLILDDSTSALDAETENEIAIAIDRLQADRTTFIISHRLATIRRADKIILLNSEGMISAIGTHNELLNRSNDYRRIFRIRDRETDPIPVSVKRTQEEND
ncbi:MAG: ABC transporter ATP-binding protein [Candidatus Hodarchaeales archaeon]